MNRLYVIESTATITGAMADHRLAVQAQKIESIVWMIAKKIGVPGIPELSPIDSKYTKWFAAMVRDLSEHRGQSLIIPGESQPPVVHALAHAMNQALGNIGATIRYLPPAEPHEAEQMDSVRRLAEDMDQGRVEALIILGGNPVFTAPADVNFKERLNKVPLRIHQSIYYDETSFYCHWHIPQSHYLEIWSDIRAFDGTISIIQPLIAPLYQSKSVHQLLATLLGQTDVDVMTPIRDYWQGQPTGQPFETFWHRALEKGIVGTSATALQIQLRTDFLKTPLATKLGHGLEIVFRPDPCIWDGRFANNGWLQELPRPLTKLTWDNAALVAPATASRLGVANEDIVKLRYQGRELEMPVWILPGHPEDSVTVYLGYGRQRSGRAGTATPNGGGFNAYLLRTSEAPWFGSGLEIVPTGRRYTLACTQPHQMMQGPTEQLIHVEKFAGYRPPEKHRTVELSLYPVEPKDEYIKGHKWAMEIDNNACIGCNACVVACQAENNIPVVGKSEVLRGREMHWLRIDTYFAGEPAHPEVYFEPIPCMQCETAPCELVCPVGATVHSSEGLNDMTYNRCVGTRYCSNNCPYKVRRFNFFQYADVKTPVLQLGHNPEVTVRERGVMEKCTYCVQRINRTRIELKKLHVEMTERGDSNLRRKMDSLMAGLETACQQACPTRAIVFGDLNFQFTGESRTERSEVGKLRDQPQSYALLEELNTRPRTEYLPRFKNPNPEMEGA
jgi:Fe-S-cluster-containing dehydrogenase component